VGFVLLCLGGIEADSEQHEKGESKANRNKGETLIFIWTPKKSEGGGGGVLFLRICGNIFGKKEELAKPAIRKKKEGRGGESGVTYG